MDNELDQILREFKSDAQLLDKQSLLIKYLGRKGKINLLLDQISSRTGEEKKVLGQKINQLKKTIEEGINSKNNGKDKQDEIDTSLPGVLPSLGQLHPTTQVINKINSFFKYHGYSIYEGPEIESDEFNFGKLNLPEDHPARDLQDTLFLSEPDWLLRTHTSSVEARALVQEELPLRIVVPGKVYRNETSNSTNNAMFYQYEGLFIDKGVSMTHLKATLELFVRYLYGENIKTRFRCKYYPQVEPGAGLDVECFFCHGSGCNVCKQRGYIEILGAGMVHPNMLEQCGVDSKIWGGFAFGMGLDRLVMLEYGISDIRKLYSGELFVL